MSRRFQVISSIGKDKEFFTGMEFDFVLENEEIGTSCNCLGGTFRITQNGKIFVLVNEDWVLTIQDITPIKEPVKPKLIINETIEVFLETKEIEIKTNCTYIELYNFLIQEWEIINTIPSINVEFPLEMRENNNLLLKDSWNIKGFELISEGSFERQNNQGRSI